MEEAIKKARIKAEGFLFNVVDRFNEGIRNEEQDIYFPADPIEDLQIRLERSEKLLAGVRTEDSGKYWAATLILIHEAYAYLALKNENLRSEFGKELTNLWSHWDRVRNYRRSYFWPSIPFHPEIAPNGLINAGLPLMRAREILGIPGFQSSFDLAIEEIKMLIMSATVDPSDAWLLLRSRTVQDTLKTELEELSGYTLEGLKKGICKLPENRDKEDLECQGEFESYISSIIILALSQLGGDYLSEARKAANTLVDHQEKNGSILNDVFLTCYFIIALYLTNVDKNKISQNRALEWLLGKQHKIGCWYWYKDKFSLNALYKGALDQLPLTVYILEAIDLVTDNKPLPLWIPSERVSDVKKKKPRRVHDVKPLEVPPGTTWNEVTIRLQTPDTARLVFPGKVIDNIDFRRMGFKDHKTKGPDKLWRVLVCLARNHGEISWKTKGIPVKKAEDLITDIKDLRNRLKYLFQIDDVPIKRYSQERGYQSKFDISLAEEFKVEEEQVSDIRKDWEEDIQRQRSERYEDIKWKEVNEIKTPKDKK